MRKLTLITLLLIIVAFSCKKAADNNAHGNYTEAKLHLDDTVGVNYFGGAAPIAWEKKAILGRVLFYDPHLSINNAVSCASCHKQQFAFADNVALSRGFENKLTGRNSLAIQNLSMNGVIVNPSRDMPGLFWDGREDDLKSLILRPLTNHIEMGVANPEEMVAKLNDIPYYKGLVKDAEYGDALTLDDIGEALAVFMNTLRSDSTRFDDFMSNRVELSALESYGGSLFHSKYNCNNCHRLEPDAYQSFIEIANIGLDKNPKDIGAGITNRFNGKGAFKAPSLRNIAVTAPYMHDGRFSTLDDVLEHYSAGIQDVEELDWRLRNDDGTPMRMDISKEDKRALIAFLNTLTDYKFLTDKRFSNPFK